MHKVKRSSFFRIESFSSTFCYLDVAIIYCNLHVLNLQISLVEFSFQNDLFQWPFSSITRYITSSAEVYLELSRTSTMELFFPKIVKAVNYFRCKTAS